MTHDAWVQAFIGGGLLGAGGALLWATLGRTVGISGIAAGIIRGQRDREWRVFFLSGLVVAGFALSFVMPESVRSEAAPSVLTAAIAGLIVGVGARVSNGCTSGHGICGVSRFSPRSFVATVTFTAAGMITLAVVRWLGGVS